MDLPELAVLYIRSSFAGINCIGYEDLEGKIDLFVAGVGTGGTITGSAKYFKEKNKNIEIIAVEPASSPMISEGRSGAHKIQGIGANFVPQNFDKNLCDKVEVVTDEDAIFYAKLLAKKDTFSKFLLIFIG